VMLVLLLSLSTGLCVGALVVCLASVLVDRKRYAEYQALLQRIEEMVRHS